MVSIFEVHDFTIYGAEGRTLHVLHVLGTTQHHGLACSMHTSSQTHFGAITRHEPTAATALFYPVLITKPYSWIKQRCGTRHPPPIITLVGGDKFPSSLEGADAPNLHTSGLGAVRSHELGILCGLATPMGLHCHN